MNELISPVTNLYILRFFLTVGAQAFGGWSTTALLLEKELVEKEGRITKQELQGAIAYAQILPGATQVAMISNVGFRLKGFSGSVIAVSSFLLPVTSLIVLFSIVYFYYLQGAEIAPYITGLTAALGGVILANAYRIGKAHISHAFLWILVFMAFALRLWFGVNTALIIIAFGVGGSIISFVKIRN